MNKPKDLNQTLDNNLRTVLYRQITRYLDNEVIPQVSNVVYKGTHRSLYYITTGGIMEAVTIQIEEDLDV